MPARDPVAMALGIITEAAPRPSRLMLPELPDPYASENQAQRFAHADLAHLTDFGLWRERKTAEVVLALDPKAPSWWRERLQRVVAEQRQRQAPTPPPPGPVQAPATGASPGASFRARWQRAVPGIGEACRGVGERR